MTLILNGNSENHLVSQNLKEIHPYRPTSQPDATGFSVDDSGSAEGKSIHSVRGTLTPHSSSGMSIPAAAITPENSDSSKQIAFRNAQL
jgi:hypothetical protein